MKRRVYAVLRELHLYAGLFSAPFVVAFGASVFFLVHAWLPGSDAEAGAPRVVSGLNLPAEVETLPARPRVEALQRALSEAGIGGEIGFVRHKVKERRLAMMVTVPGREKDVEIDLAAKTATVEERETGVWDALVYLHKAPGPHLVDLRRNWWPMKVWAWLADGTVYLVFLLTLSGLYLWAVVKAERRAGLAWLGAGVVTFAGVLYAVVH
jgi:hypothetical protein